MGVAACSMSAPALATESTPHQTHASTIQRSTAGAGVLPTTDRLIVKFKNDARSGSTLADASKKNASLKNVESISTTTNDAKVISVDKQLDATAQNKAVDSLKTNPNVEYVEPDRRIASAAASTPNDPMWSQQTSLQAAHTNDSWDYATGKGQTIAIVDTGITKHPDLDANVLPGYDFVTGEYDRDNTPGRDGDPTDPGVLTESGSWHGTHVASTAAGVTNNNQGVASEAPGAKILPVRAMGVSSGGYESDFADAITWASGGTVAGTPHNSNPANVVNFSASWKGQCSNTISSAISGAQSRNVPVVVAAGNDTANTAQYAPTNCSGPIVVGSSDPGSNLRSGFSNWGSNIDVLAPGLGMMSASNDGWDAPGNPTYSGLSGTSMSAAVVSGIIAQIKQEDPSVTIDELRTALKNTGHKVDSDEPYMIVDAKNAVAQFASNYKVVGGIKDAYEAHGGQSKFGMPTMNEQGGLVDGGVFQDFANSNYSIMWSPKSGAHSINLSGAIGEKYRNNGAEKTYGYPTTEETTNKDGSAWQMFQKANGQTYAILWSKSTGTHAVLTTGAIGEKWRKENSEHGINGGMPVSEESPTGNGGYWQTFISPQGRKNTYLWTPSTGAHIAYEQGAIGTAWAKAGRERNYGFPLNEESQVNGVWSQKFSKHTTVSWGPRQGTRIVR